jgi:hypothetical protein
MPPATPMSALRFGARFGDLAIVAFLAAQAADGVLTYVGTALMGPAIEGNPLIIALMAGLGQGLGITATKIVAGSLGILLHFIGVHRVIAILTGLYFVIAILPWTSVLFF